MEKFTDYLKEKLQNEEILVGYINEALEQYFVVIIRSYFWLL
ncbi:hypothetical protein RMONA_01880 [Rickettsia monacensis]|uniref:Uncharacterized protein n=1 Tax=Rickettsia monacensis TaxID=109232 RepID=A0A0B7J1I7_9RICK|nr:hypothetical protein [Rickettsia monacensis]CDI29001.1 hypothetical protein RMONA_1650 [Rickettsia monacensis IrR/Munich]CEO16785.1 hypothetical protein RMONA_01880 [Rickettsia monacensis]